MHTSFAMINRCVKILSTKLFFQAPALNLCRSLPSKAHQRASLCTKSNRLPLSQTQRSGLQHSGGEDTLQDIDSIANIDKGETALAIIKPDDPNKETLVRAINPFWTHSSSEIFALVTVNKVVRSKGPSKDVDESQLHRKLLQACAGQDRFVPGDMYTDASIKRGTGRLGPNHVAKLQPGAPVAVEFSETMNYFYGYAETYRANPNPHQGYGKIVQLRQDTEGNVISADVNFEGIYIHDYEESVQFLDVTDSGFVRNVSANRLIAHARFRNIDMLTLLEDLQWEIALLWPEPVALEEVKFIDVQTGEYVSSRMPKNVRDFLEGDIGVEVQGHRVCVLDPGLAIKPRGVNLKVTQLFFTGFAAFVIGIHTYPFFLVPTGIASMALAVAVESSWSIVSKAERIKLSKDLTEDPPETKRTNQPETNEELVKR